MHTLIYDFGFSEIRKDNEMLSSTIKPDFSFTYDAVNYNSVGVRKYRVGNTETDLTAEQAAEIEAYIVSTEADPVTQASRVALTHLEHTDWYVIRLTETGLAIPAEVTASRAAARLLVVPNG